MNTISAISFGQRIRIAKDEKSAQQLKQVSNASTGTSLISSGVSSGIDTLSISSGLAGTGSFPPGLLMSSLISPELTSQALSHINPAIILSAESASAAGLGAAGYKMLEKTIPSDEQDIDPENKINIEKDN